METATESDCDTETSETTEERAVEDIVNKRLDTVRYTAHVLSLFKNEQRNKTFVNIVGYLIGEETRFRAVSRARFRDILASF